MKKIVIIDHEPYSQRRKDLFFIQRFIDEGYDIQVWDVSQYVFGNIHVNGTLDHESYVTKVSDGKQLEKLLSMSDINHTVFWIECLNNWKNRFLYRLLSNYKCKTLRIDLYANTVLHESKKSKLKRLFSRSFTKIVKGKWSLFAYNIYKRIYHIHEVDCYLSSSALVHRTGKINHPDYEKFRSMRSKAIVNGNYIVFCDTYFPFHPDLITFYNCKNLPDGKAYHATLQHFFDYLEATYKMPVIIAAHPKAAYSGCEFGNRKIIQGQTDNLVFHACMVVQHASNSISYVALGNKPVALITTNDYNQVIHLREHLALLASTLRKYVYNLDNDPFEQIEISTIADEVRKDYIYTYLTSPETEKLENWNIIQNAITSL